MKTTIIAIIFGLLLLPLASALEVSVNDYDPKPAEAGQFVTVWLRVDNTDTSESSTARLELVPKDGLRLPSGEDNVREIRPIGGLSYSIVKYQLEVIDNPIEGPNRIEVIIDSQGTEISRDLEIEVSEKDRKEAILQVGNIQSDPTRIKPGDDLVKLSVTLQNLGDADALATSTRLENLPEGVSFSDSYSDTSLLGNVESDSMAVAEFYLDVSEGVIPNAYETNLVVEYKYKPYADEDDYLIEEIILPVRLTIKELPLYEISNVEFNKKVLAAGDKNIQMRITITNIGEDEGESVRLKIYGKSEQPFEYDINNAFVAPSLKPGESGQATIEFDIDEEAALQKYLLDVEIKNLVGNDVVTYEKTIPVEVSQGKQGSPMGIIITLIVIVVIVGLFVTFRRKKRARKHGRVKRIKPAFEK